VYVCIGTFTKDTLTNSGSQDYLEALAAQWLLITQHTALPMYSGSKNIRTLMLAFDDTAAELTPQAAGLTMHTKGSGFQLLASSI
jgi:hypothetical protein